MKSFIVIFAILAVFSIRSSESLQCYNCLGNECKSLKDSNLVPCTSSVLAMACYKLNSNNGEYIL